MPRPLILCRDPKLGFDCNIMVSQAETERKNEEEQVGMNDKIRLLISVKGIDRENARLPQFTDKLYTIRRQIVLSQTELHQCLPARC